MMSPVFRAAALLIAFAVPAAGETRTHYAPRENLEHIDVALLNGARETIDFAGYIVTDRPVIDALNAAKARGVSVRLLLDHTQRHDLERLAPVLSEARKKRRGPIMHLKAYLIDGRLLRTGSANFTASGLKQQDNDLVVIDDTAAAFRFEQNFERMWDAALPIVAVAP